MGDYVGGMRNSIKFQVILAENAVLSVAVRKLKLGLHWTFKQSSDGKHVSISSKAWFQKKS